MSKVEILAELPKLKWEDRREIFQRIGELEEHDLLHGGEPLANEKALLDGELAEYRAHPEADRLGMKWSKGFLARRIPCAELYFLVL